MAIYRPPRPRYRIALLCLGIGLLTGLATGLVLGGGESDPRTTAQEVRVSLVEAASLLEIVEIEYEEGLEATGDIQNQELSGARDALQRSRQRWGEAKGLLELIDPSGTEEIDAAYSNLQEVMEQEAAAEVVAELTADLGEILDPTGADK